MNLNMPISEIMTTNVLFVHFNNKLSEVEGLMKKKNIRHVPVLKEGKLKGIISLTDLERLFFTKSYADHDEKEFMYNSLNLEDIMMKQPYTVENNASIKNVADILIKNNFHALPVMENEILVGIVTTTDLMRYLLDTEEGMAA